MIEALPPLRTGEQMLPHFGRKPRFDETERTLPETHRMLCVSRLNNYLVMMPAHAHIIEQIGLLIHSGYVHRNPVRPEFKKSLVHFYRQSMGGEIRPIETSGPSTAPSFSLFGVSGAGKSTVVERALSFFPQALSHVDHGILQLVWLKVDCPMDGSLKQLLLSIIAKIDTTLGTNHAKSIGRTTTIDKLILDVAKISAQHHLGVLVVDEIQHLLSAPGVGPAKMLNFFVTFANEVKVPFVVLGTPKAKGFLDTLFREARRLSDHGSTTWDRMARDQDWDFFLKALWKYQWLQNAERLSPELSEAFYAQTQGISALVVRLFQLVQLQAIRGKTERVTVGLINKVAKEKFALLRPALEALRSGNQKRISDFEDLLAAGITQLNEQLDPEKQAQTLKMAQKRVNEQRKRLTSNLLHVGQDPKLVGAIVDKVVSSANADAIGFEQLATLSKNARSPSAANKLVATVQEAEAANVDPIEALAAAGLIAELDDR
ncbi:MULTISPECIES: ATP-binding protein [unclassified Bradyrhizobium]|uniref:ATP-binding protein n=1 Tax=unclassified Bradyrhizobium TaxID=2631580 RepID=UPI002FF3387E